MKTTRRQSLLALAAAGATLVAGTTWAQPARRLRVACPGGPDDEGARSFRARVESGLGAAGVKDVEVRSFFSSGNDFAGSVREALAWQPDAIFVAGPLFAQAARDATTTVPIVFFAVPEPESFGLVRSLARPGGNITGRGLNAAEGTLKRLEVIPEILPKARRVAMFYRDPQRGELLQRVRSRIVAAAPGLKLELVSHEVTAGRGFRSTLAAMTARLPDAVLPFGPYAWEPDGSEVDSFAAWIDFERRHRVPVIGETEHIVRQGGLVALYDGGAQLGPAIAILARVLKGESPANIPVELPVSFRVAVNRSAARHMGITLPASLMVRADVVVD